MTVIVDRRIGRSIRIAFADETADPVVAKNFLKHLRDNGFNDGQFAAEPQALVLMFMETARKNHSYQSVVCLCDGEIVGSTGCQLYDPPYPVVFPKSYMRLGYIWGVYVEPQFRGQTIGSHMTETAVSYLKSIGCTRVLLHASQFGRSLYERIGFVASDEMKLNLLGLDQRD